VDSISSGYVTSYGPGLTHGVCGEPSNFTISTKGAGAGKISKNMNHNYSTN
jgi:filamin